MPADRPPSIRLVATHFGGALPAFFPLTLRSMAANPDVSWLLLTDQPVPDPPPNVAVRSCTFADLAARIRGHFDFPVSLERPYKVCDFRPAFGEIFAAELDGYDFWGCCDLDVVFGRIRDHLPAAAYEADKILFQGNFQLYRNSPAAAGWYRHEVGKVSYRDAFTRPEAMHFDEWAGIYYIVEDLGVRSWQQDVIFDLSFKRYRTRAESPPGRDPRRYAWEDGEICEYRVAGGAVRRRTALLIHLQKRTMLAPGPDVLAAGRYWIGPRGFAVQRRVTPWTVRVPLVQLGPELVPFYLRRVQRYLRRRAVRKAVAEGRTTVQV
ncbi:MAG TPA: DUF6625 family protein [Mycobacteriales bacterium]